MFARGGGLLKKSTSAAQASIARDNGARHRHFSAAEKGSRPGKISGGAAENHHPSSSEAKQKRESDREFLISVLESAATKRDAKAYLQTFGSATGTGSKRAPAFTAIVNDGPLAQSNSPRFIQGPVSVPATEASDVPHIAIVKLGEPESWDDAVLDGVAKTLTQLRDLGLRSVVVLDSNLDRASTGRWRELVSQQTNRFISAIGRYGSPGAELVASGIWKRKNGVPQRHSTVGATDLYVGFGPAFTTPLKHSHIIVVPPRALDEETLRFTEAGANDIVVALTNFFSGLQFDNQSAPEGKQEDDSENLPARKATVDRIIVIDPYGGIPASSRGDGARVFVNLEEEFDTLQSSLVAHTQGGSPMTTEESEVGEPTNTHARNLRLVQSTLATLPSTASAVITSPVEAANLRPPTTQVNQSIVGQIAGEVKTRRWQNPLIHNLLTDRPIYSASLPIGRIKPSSRGSGAAPPRMPTTTLAKRGLPVTIFPDPRTSHWQPPKPGMPRLRLTDTCIDLPRLVHLINDSFNRKLDVEHYLRRVEDSLAGIIIAGEYEGGAILTWERPHGLDEEAAYRAGRLVPYLDKFAVLKRSQGAGGVADIVFNAMVRDCFPRGVCWRSRKDNPVNKWYFERSCGVRKLPESNWAMFWTTPEAATSGQLMRDYEDVCRNVVPSWEDLKPAD